MQCITQNELPTGSVLNHFFFFQHSKKRKGNQNLLTY